MLENLLLAICAFSVGYFLRDIKDISKKAYAIASERIKEPIKETEVKSMIVEPLTPEQQAQKDFQDRVKKLNGQI